MECPTYYFTKKSYIIDKENLKTCKKKCFFESARVFELCLHQKSFEEPSINQNCRLVSYHLKSLYTNYNLIEPKGAKIRSIM